MPIIATRTGEGADEKLTIEVTNGDLRQFDLVKKKWRFKNAKTFLEFALAIFSTEGVEIFLNHEGDKTRVKPSDELVDNPNNSN